MKHRTLQTVFSRCGLISTSSIWCSYALAKVDINYVLYITPVTCDVTDWLRCHCVQCPKKQKFVFSVFDNSLGHPNPLFLAVIFWSSKSRCKKIIHFAMGEVRIVCTEPVFEQIINLSAFYPLRIFSWSDRKQSEFFCLRMAFERHTAWVFQRYNWF